MPQKRAGQTQKSIQFPDELLAAADAKRGGLSLNAYVCELVARDTGAAFEHKAPGRPRVATGPEKPAPKKGKPRAKGKAKK